MSIQPKEILYTKSRNEAHSTYFHITNSNILAKRLRGVAIGYRLIGEYLVVAKAVCLKLDNYNKPFGRALVDARLDSVSVQENGKDICYSNNRMLSLYRENDLNSFFHTRNVKLNEFTKFEINMFISDNVVGLVKC